MVDLGTMGGTSAQATIINEAGTLAGYYQTSGGAYRAFVSDGSTSTDIGSLGGSFTYPAEINASGYIVGTSSTPTSANVAYVYRNGTMTNIAPPNSETSEGIAISGNGKIAGSYVPTSAPNTRRAFLQVGATQTLISGLGGTFATATDVDNFGRVIGYSSGTPGVNTHGFIFEAGQVKDLNLLVPSGTALEVTVPFEINASGTILRPTAALLRRPPSDAPRADRTASEPGHHQSVHHADDPSRSTQRSDLHAGTGC